MSKKEDQKIDWWGELRSVLAEPEWSLQHYMTLLDILLQMDENEVLERVFLYCECSRADIEWEIVEWCFACHKWLKILVCEATYPAEPRYEGEREFIRGLAWMGLTGAKTERSTCAARVSERHWAVVCVMDDDRCPGALLGCYDPSVVGQARARVFPDTEDYKFDHLVSTLIQEPGLNDPWEWPIQFGDISMLDGRPNRSNISALELDVVAQPGYAARPQDSLLSHNINHTTFPRLNPV